MGNHQSHSSLNHLSSGDEKSQGGSGTVTPRGGSKKGMSPSSSGADIQEKPITSLVSIDKLAKFLVHKAHEEDGVSGITENSFMRYLFPNFPDLARHFFHYLHVHSKSKHAYIGSSAFKQQCEKFLAIMDDAVIIENYVRMFSKWEDNQLVECDNLTSLLMTCYKLTMFHYPEGPQTCLMIHRSLRVVVDSCFHKKEVLSVSFVARWLEQNCHRLILPMHRYCVHVLSTAHRSLEANLSSGAGLELATPVLEKPAWEHPKHSATLLPVSVAWLLAGALPSVYSRPLTGPPAVPSFGSGLASIHFIQRLVCTLPSHWTPLYESREHGLGANRFLHHVLAYRGPTLVLLQGCDPENGNGSGKVSQGAQLFCLASTAEWRESHLYWGGQDSILVQILPTFSIVEHGPKMLYLNTSIRGYPKGLRAGSDPRDPMISIDEGFERLEYRHIPYLLEAIEVWGCGDQALREAQLDVKKWQVKEAERQRTVKLSASDWIDHPDRYLLQLAGRPQYNSTAN